MALQQGEMNRVYPNLLQIFTSCSLVGRLSCNTPNEVTIGKANESLTLYPEQINDTITI